MQIRKMPFKVSVSLGGAFRLAPYMKTVLMKNQQANLLKKADT